MIDVKQAIIKLSKYFALFLDTIFNLFLIFIVGNMLVNSLYIDENSLWVELKNIHWQKLLEYSFSLVAIFLLGYVIFYFVATMIFKKNSNTNPKLFLFASRTTFITPIILFFVFAVPKDLFILVSSIVSFSAIFNIFFKFIQTK